MKVADKIAREYRDSDGYWIELAPGWKTDDCHTIHEDTRRSALAKLRLVRPCDCAQCKQMRQVNQS
jgi:hypothetical protein